jgi:hypothetical protein
VPVVGSRYSLCVGDSDRDSKNDTLNDLLRRSKDVRRRSRDAMDQTKHDDSALSESLQRSSEANERADAQRTARLPAPKPEEPAEA